MSKASKGFESDKTFELNSKTFIDNFTKSIPFPMDDFVGCEYLPNNPNQAITLI